MPSESLFARQVIAAVRRIPPGHVATYGDVAAMAGRPLASRAVGTLMKNCSERDVPCHRVVAAGGLLGGYGSSPELKRALLRAEGLQISGRRIRNFDARRWKAHRRADRTRRAEPAPGGRRKSRE